MHGCLPSRRTGRFGFLRTRNESFRSLVRRHAFYRIQHRLENMRSFKMNIEWLYEDIQQPLHFILPHRPPVAVVELILQHTDASCHVPEEALDDDGRTPLHVAAAHNCSFEVIERLLSGVSLVVPALTRDNMDRYPLHWACIYPCLQGRSGNDNKFDTILLLLDAYPQAVCLTDTEGKTPLDYATYRVQDKRVVDVLDRASKKHARDLPPGKNIVHRVSPKATTDVTELTAASLGTKIPIEVDAALGGNAQYFLTRHLFRKAATAMDDDVSSLGWDRSVATSGPLSPKFSASFTEIRSPSRRLQSELLTPVSYLPSDIMSPSGQNELLSPLGLIQDDEIVSPEKHDKVSSPENKSPQKSVQSPQKESPLKPSPQKTEIASPIAMNSPQNDVSAGASPATETLLSTPESSEDRPKFRAKSIIRGHMERLSPRRRLSEDVGGWTMVEPVG